MCPCLPVSPHSCIRSVGLVVFNIADSYPDPAFGFDADVNLVFLWCLEMSSWARQPVTDWQRKGNLGGGGGQ
jgi:hypothetical protein